MTRSAASTPGRPDAARHRVLEQIAGLGLNDHLLAIETEGYTVLPGVLSADQIQRARAAILARAARLAGREIDPGSETGDVWTGQRYLPYLLYDDPVFEEILMAPGPLALVTYLLGESCLLSSMGCHFKGPGGDPLVLHSDNGNGMPAPFSAVSMVANVNYALTPYSRAAGALAIVPGSHRLARQPTAREMRLDEGQANPDAVAMDIAPGDAVIWHGNTWHGSFARQIPGIRMNLAVYFNRQHIQTQERHKGVVPADVLERHRNDERFRILLGEKQPYGWQEEGPDYTLMAGNPRGLFD